MLKTIPVDRYEFINVNITMLKVADDLLEVKNIQNNAVSYIAPSGTITFV